MQRDIRERGRTVIDVISQYESTVRPMHHEFVEPSKRNADVIVPVGMNDPALGMVVAKLRESIIEYGIENIDGGGLGTDAELLFEGDSADGVVAEGVAPLPPSSSSFPSLSSSSSSAAEAAGVGGYGEVSQ